MPSDGKVTASVVVVVHVCKADFAAACRWIRWARVLATQPQATPYDVVFLAARSLDSELLATLRAEITGWSGAQVQVNPELYEHPELGYAAMANHAFRSALEMTERLFPGRPTLWCETDCIPTCPSWVSDINRDYAIGGKPFMGDFHANNCACPHMTGNGVYPPDWRKLAPSIAKLPSSKPERQGWDSKCSHEIVPQSHHSFRIQQVWQVPPLHFTEKNIWAVHPDTALFHRCKDGSLIDVLEAQMKSGKPVRKPFLDDCNISATRAALGTIVNKMLAKAEQGTPASVELFPAVASEEASFVSNVEIMIVTFRRDRDFVEYLLKSIRRYAKGFSGVTLVVPNGDLQKFPEKDDIRVVGFDEIAGKGMVHHMIQICRADEICPNASAILHMDADCMFWKETTPETYISNGKHLLVREPYSRIGNQNRHIWRRCVKAAVGIDPKYDCMVRHPNIYPREVYKRTRERVEAHTGKKFEDYVISGDNNFPQNFCEFNTLAAVALADFKDQFNVVEYDHDADSAQCGFPPNQFQYIYRPERDSAVEFWSHSGIASYRNDAEKFLIGHLPPFYLK